MSEHNAKPSEWESQMKSNTFYLAKWTGAWLLTTALVAFGSKYLWDYQTGYTIAAVVLNIIVGFGMVMANKKHLDGSDELMKRVQFEAMGIALGVGLVLGLSYEQLEEVKLIAYQPEISHLVILMALTYAVAVILGHRKYS